MSPAHDDAVAAWLRMRDAEGAVHAELVQHLPLGQYHLRALRAVADGARSLAAVADATDGHIASVARLVDELVLVDLVMRTPDPDDRRHVVLRATAHGHQLANRFAALDRALSSRLVTMLSEQEAALLAAALGRMTAAAADVVAELELDPTALDGLL